MRDRGRCVCIRYLSKAHSDTQAKCLNQTTPRFGDSAVRQSRKICLTVSRRLALVVWRTSLPYGRNGQRWKQRMGGTRTRSHAAVSDPLWLAQWQTARRLVHLMSACSRSRRALRVLPSELLVDKATRECGARPSRLVTTTLTLPGACGRVFALISVALRHHHGGRRRGIGWHFWMIALEIQLVTEASACMTLSSWARRQSGGLHWWERSAKRSERDIRLGRSRRGGCNRSVGSPVPDTGKL